MNLLITGCSTGIGYFCAKELHKQGYNVLATCRYAKDVKRLEDEGLSAYQLDLRDSKSIKDAVAWAEELSGGKIDVLFNNGAYGQPGAVEDLSRTVLKEQFETNVFGTQELTNEVLPLMRKHGHGRVIYNSSILGFVSMSYRGAYNSSKYAIEVLCDTLRLELKGSGIDIVLIEPGPIRSDFRKNALKKFKSNIDIERSVHEKVYKKTLERLEGKENAPFTLGEEAVYKVLIKAIESKNPKNRYRVTLPSKLFWFLKRVLSSRILDKILGSVG
jgi:NAD(P)-dependent dehydrogenase (short-subunit alcohol dehydrogenase family)